MTQAEYINKLEGLLVGRTIVGSKYCHDPEVLYGWEPHRSVIELTLDNGWTVVPMQDEEGNGPGALLVRGDDNDETVL